MTDAGIEAVRAARRELDAVIDEIRAVPGFKQFLAAPTFDDIARAADRCPLVYLAASDYGGLALVVRGDQVTHVPLEEMTSDAVRAHVTAHLDAYAAYHQDRATGRAAWSRSLSDVTRWLWTAGVGAVVDELSDTSEAVFVAGGLLGMLPLHAAWTPDPGTPTRRRYALDAVVISYAPNARGLQAARDLAESVSGKRLLSVVDPRPVHAGPLPYAQIEARGFAASLSTVATELPGGRATPLNVRRHVGDADILHLACHGFADLANPLRSGLRLARQDLLLADLMEMRIGVRLAVLSACETALPGTELPDEVIALPTGLLQAGVAGIVASQWSVPDRATAMVMVEFGRRWAGGRLPPAVALRDAQRWLRDTTNREKRRHWEAARHDEPAVPPEVVDAFLDELAWREPGDQDHEDLHAWAAFAHVGA